MKEERGRGFFDEGVAWLARGDYREGGRSGRADDDFRLFLVVDRDWDQTGPAVRPVKNRTREYSGPVHLKDRLCSRTGK